MDRSKFCDRNFNGWKVKMWVVIVGCIVLEIRVEVFFG